MNSVIQQTDELGLVQRRYPPRVEILDAADRSYPIDNFRHKGADRNLHEDPPSGATRG